jgi:hypothetical protein
MMYVAAGVGVLAVGGIGWWLYNRNAAANGSATSTLPSTSTESMIPESTAPTQPRVPAPSPTANANLPPAQAAAANLKTYYFAGGRDPAIIRPIQQAMGNITADGVVGPATVARAGQLGISIELTAGDKTRFRVA